MLSYHAQHEFAEELFLFINVFFWWRSTCPTVIHQDISRSAKNWHLATLQFCLRTIVFQLFCETREQTPCKSYNTRKQHKRCRFRPAQRNAFRHDAEVRFSYTESGPTSGETNATPWFFDDCTSGPTHIDPAIFGARRPYARAAIHALLRLRKKPRTLHLGSHTPLG